MRALAAANGDHSLAMQRIGRDINRQPAYTEHRVERRIEFTSAYVLALPKFEKVCQTCTSG
jgi:hypothetical protein